MFFHSFIASHEMRLHCFCCFVVVVVVFFYLSIAPILMRLDHLYTAFAGGFSVEKALNKKLFASMM